MEKTNLEKTLSQSRETQDRTEREHKKLQEEFESQSADLANFQSDIEASNTEKEELLGALNARATEAFRLEREEEELRKKLKNMEEERDSLDEDKTRLSGQVELLKKQLTEIKSDNNNKNNAQEKDAERTEPSVPVTGDQRLLKVQTELEALKGEIVEMKKLLRTKDETIKHMEVEVLPFVRAWCQEQGK